MTLAQECHAAVRALDMVEQKIGALLSDVAVKWSDFTTDHYDNSIEVYGVTPSSAIHDACKAAGFTLVWQHDHDPPRGGCVCSTKRPEPA